MIEYIVKIYGINCKNKWIGYLTTGLTLSIFWSLAFPVIYAKNSSNKTNEFFFKLLMSKFCASKILNYLAIKYNSSNLFHLNYKLKNYQKKHSISELNIHIFSFISLCFSIVMILIATKLTLCDPYVVEICKDLTETMESLPIPPFSQIFVMDIYVNSWFIVIQLLYIEIKTRYIAIIKDFEKEVERIVDKLDNCVIILMQRTILMFVEFKDDIRKNVDFLKYGIFIELVLPIAIIVLSHGSSLKLECYPFSIPFVVLMIGSYLWTMSYNLSVNRYENDLTLNLNRWLNPKYEDSDQIEIKVIERTAKQFNEQKSIDESNPA
jgi:hypothetical protein